MIKDLKEFCITGTHMMMFEIHNDIYIWFMGCKNDNKITSMEYDSTMYLVLKLLQGKTIWEGNNQTLGNVYGKERQRQRE